MKKRKDSNINNGLSGSYITEQVNAEKVANVPTNETRREEVAVEVKCKEDVDGISYNEKVPVENVTDGKNNECEASTRSEVMIKVETNIQKVYATVEFTGLKQKLSNADVDGLLYILRSKDHLRRNIKSVEEGTLTLRNQDDRVVHSLPLVLDVETTYLWESPRSYIFHHLGRDSWTLGDGTVMKIFKIHQK